MGKLRLLLTIALILTVAGSSLAGSAEDLLLKLPVWPPSEEIHSLPLTSALTNLGSRVNGGYVLFGVEVMLKEGKEPEILLPHKATSNLGSDLHEVLRQLAGYEMRFVPPRLFEILPRHSESDPTDLLNVRVANFSVKNKPATSIIAYPERFIPELETIYREEHPLPPNGIQVFSGPYQIPAMTITLQLQNVSVRQILESVVAETEHIPADWQPSGWVLAVNSDNTPGVPSHAWRLLSGVPGDWRKYRAR